MPASKTASPSISSRVNPATASNISDILTSTVLSPIQNKLKMNLSRRTLIPLTTTPYSIVHSSTALCPNGLFARSLRRPPTVYFTPDFDSDHVKLFPRVSPSFFANLHRNRGRITKIATDLTLSRRVPQCKSIGPLGKFLPTCSPDSRRCGASAYAAAANGDKQVKSREPSLTIVIFSIRVLGLY